MKHNTTIQNIHSYLGQGQPVQERTEGAESDMNHFSLLKMMSFQQCRESFVLQEEQLMLFLHVQGALTRVWVFGGCSYSLPLPHAEYAGKNNLQ